MVTELSELKSFINDLGECFHKSGIFGCLNVQQGKILALESVTGRALSIAKEWHMFPNGRMTRRADSILAGFNEIGGTHVIKKREPDEVAIELTFNGVSKLFVLTWEEAQKEPFVYQGKEAEIVDALAKGHKKPLKTKYATPHSRMQMLWARLISDAVRAMAPSVVAGRYTPEELGLLDRVFTAERKTVEVVAPKVIEHVAEPENIEPVADEPSPPTSVEAAPEPIVESTATLEAIPALITEMQLKKLSELLDYSGAPAQAIQAACMRRGGVKHVNLLSMVAAAEWISELQQKFGANGFSQSENDPCTPDQVSRIKKTLENLYQSGNQEIGERVYLKLQSQGLRLANLTVAQASELQRALDIKEIEAWAANALQGNPKKAG